jgi:acyl dehydratase
MIFDEKLQIGETVTLGSHVFLPDEIKAFARTYDPQPFHVDEEKAAASLFGGLCASGWHTAAMWMRYNVLSRPATEARIRAAGAVPPLFGPSGGIKDLKWLKPVYAGDTITFTRTALSHRPMPNRPGWRLLTSRCEAANQKGEIVMQFSADVMVREGREFGP